MGNIEKKDAVLYFYIDSYTIARRVMQLEQYFLEPEEIPSMPHVIVKALNIIKDDNSGVKELASIISCDQSLSTKVLRLVNSVHFALLHKIDSTYKAVCLLGMNQTKNIIISIAMKSVVFEEKDKDIWSHSIRCAVACELLAKEYKLISPEEAFVIGFLHDIGKVILCRKESKTYNRIVDLTKRGVNYLDAEEMYLKTNHAVLGAYIAKKWELSDTIVEAIRYHHSPLKSSNEKITALVYYADVLSEDSFAEPEFDKEVARVTGIYIKDYFKIKNAIKTGTEKLQSMLMNV